MLRYMWTVMVFGMLGSAAWAEVVAVPSTSPIPPAPERTDADNEELARLLAHRALGRKLKVRGTPSFRLGHLHPDGEGVSVVRRIGGARTYALFSRHHDRLFAALPAGAGSEISAVVPQDRRP